MAYARWSEVTDGGMTRLELFCEECEQPFRRTIFGAGSPVQKRHPESSDPDQTS
jgi:hypothetical protein